MKKYYLVFTVIIISMLIVFGMSYTHNYIKQYVISNDIQVHYTDTNNGQDSSSNITAEQAEKHAYAVHLHNLITAQNFEWYGSCFYDFDDDIIKVGLTANITENQRQIIDLIGESSIQFYNCEYSYQYLESVYKKLDSQQLLLYAVGVERYSISIEKNRIRVKVSNQKNYLALYFVNELDIEQGAILFTTTSYYADT